MCRPLPNITGSCARGADLLGAFGLVRLGLTNRYQGLACAGRRFLVGLVAVTNPYHAAILSAHLPCEAFTKHYHRGEGLGMTEYYIGLELVVGGAVDEGDVVLSFIG